MGLTRVFFGSGRVSIGPNLASFGELRLGIDKQFVGHRPKGVSIPHWSETREFPVDRVSGRPWASPVIDISYRDPSELPWGTHPNIYSVAVMRLGGSASRRVKSARPKVALLSGSSQRGGATRPRQADALPHWLRTGERRSSKRQRASPGPIEQTLRFQPTLACAIGALTDCLVH